MKSSRQSWIALALALAIVFSTLLPFLATYQPITTSSKVVSLLGEKILICTGQGFALVDRKDAQSGKVPVKQHTSYFCPLCYIAASPMGKLLLLAAALFLLAGEKAKAAALFFLYEARLRTFIRAASSPRAPPFS